MSISPSNNSEIVITIFKGIGGTLFAALTLVQENITWFVGLIGAILFSISLGIDIVKKVKNKK